MDFRLVTKQNKRSETSAQTADVTVPAVVLDEVIELLENVECTCVWSPIDSQYVKVNDIPVSLVEQLKMQRSLSQLSKT